jgi:hypothetical protein
MMKEVALLFCVGFCILTLATINQGCNNNPTAATATPTPNYVTFNITNNGFYHWNSSTTYTGPVTSVCLTRNSTGTSYSQTCSIPTGTSSNVNVVIPADDTYTVNVYSNAITNIGFNRSATFNTFSFTRGTTYTVNLAGGSASTLNTTPSSGDF